MTKPKPQIEAVIGEDPSGARVITEIRYFYPDSDAVPVGGINAKDVRNISFWSLIKDSYQDAGYSLTTEEEERLVVLIRDYYPSNPGRVPVPDIYLAGIAYLFDKQLRDTPRNPVAILADSLGVPVRTLTTRMKKVRSLGYLSSGVPTPGGNARGNLTSKAVEAIKNYLS